MIRFSEFARNLSTFRTKEVKDPHFRFHRNGNGLMQCTFRANLLLRTKKGIQPLGNGLICFADESASSQSVEGELIRSGRWKSFQVGKLWAFLNGKTILLAKVDPTGATNLASGFISEEGEFLIDKE